MTGSTGHDAYPFGLTLVTPQSLFLIILCHVSSTKLARFQSRQYRNDDMTTMSIDLTFRWYLNLRTCVLEDQ